MKKIASLICVLIMIVGICSVGMISANADVNAAKTEITVKTGDKVTYTLTLGGVKERVIGCDFSLYYDPEIFELESVADFNDKTDPGEWTPLINTNLYGEIKGNWSILNGVDFSSDRHFLTMNLKAKANGSAHLSYFLRYLYDNNIFNSTDKPQITEYKLTCDVLINGQPYVEDAAPELNVDAPQKTGTFVNSVTGDSKDADPSIPGTVAKPVAKSGGNNSGSNSGNNSSSGNNSGSNSGSGNKTNESTGNNSKPAATSAPDATAGSNVVVPVETNAKGEIVNVDSSKTVNTATPDQTAAEPDKKGGSPALWIVIGAIVLIAAGVVVYYVVKRKGAKAGNSAADKSSTKDNSDKSE